MFDIVWTYLSKFYVPRLRIGETIELKCPFMFLDSTQMSTEMSV